MLTRIKSVSGVAGSGKALPMDALVLTNRGWMLNSSIKVGTKVATVDGSFADVLEVHDNARLEMYEILFNDNTRCICCKDHLWTYTHRGKTYTDSTYNLYGRQVSNSYLYIPLIESPIQYPQNIIGYTDDLFNLCAAYTLLRADVKTRIVAATEILSIHTRSHFKYNVDYIKNNKGFNALFLYQLSNSLQKRKGNTYYFYKDKVGSYVHVLLDLIRGLGGFVVAYESFAKGQPIYVVEVKYLEQLGIGKRPKGKRIMKIYRKGSYQPGRCILIDHPSHLYVTQDYVVTHNTYKLQQAVEENKLILTASTGIAAVNLHETACTIHSLLGAIKSEQIVQKIITGKIFRSFSNLFKSKNGIAIDEAPMLSAQYIDSLIEAMDRYGAATNRQLELYLTGDIAQLPPIEGKPYFDSINIDRFDVEVLTKVHRQTDPLFKEALNDLRLGNTAKIKQLLIDNNCFHKELDPDFLGLTLFSTKRDVAAYNGAKLASIDNRSTEYIGHKTGRIDRSWDSFLEPLVLKVGCLVRCITNHTVATGEYIANGDMAIVEELYNNCVVVRLLRNEKSVVISYIQKRIVNPETGIEQGTINYVPLRLSFASTIHAIQGITSDYIQVRMDRTDYFMGRSSGMSYVALSRCPLIKGIRVVGSPNDFDSCVYIDPKYLAFVTNGTSN
jgi:hypothetical protein